MSVLNVNQNTGVESVQIKQETLPPLMYKVLLLNDDFTPMDFVVDILMHVFFMEENQAVSVMLMIHHHGQGLCGIYAKDIAETKVSQVAFLAREQEYPLKCIMEEE